MTTKSNLTTKDTMTTKNTITNKKYHDIKNTYKNLSLPTKNTMTTTNIKITEITMTTKKP